MLLTPMLVLVVSAAPTWTRFESKPDRLALDVAGPPTVTKREAGKVMLVRGRGAMLSIAVHQQAYLSPSSTYAKELFTEQRAILQTLGAVVSQRTRTLGGVSGVEFGIRMKDGSPGLTLVYIGEDLAVLLTCRSDHASASLPEACTRADSSLVLLDKNGKALAPVGVTVVRSALARGADGGVNLQFAADVEHAPPHATLKATLACRLDGGVQRTVSEVPITSRPRGETQFTMSFAPPIEGHCPLMMEVNASGALDLARLAFDDATCWDSEADGGFSLCPDSQGALGALDPLPDGGL